MSSPPAFTVRPAAALAAAVLAAAGLAAAGLAAAGCAGPRAHKGEPEPAPRRLEAPGRGAIVLEVPDGWKVATAPGLDPSAPVVMRLEPPGGKAQGVVSFIATGEAEDGIEPAEAARLFTLMARRKALGTEGEASAPLEELRGARAIGYWFVATDPTPPAPPEPGAPHAFRNLLRGAAAVGRLVVTFTLLDDGPGPEREALLGMIRGAREAADDEPGRPLRGEEAEAGAPAEPGAAPGALRFEPDPEAATEPLQVLPPDVPFTVLVDLPGFTMFRPRPAEDGEGVLVLGQAPESGLVASVTVAPAGDAADARACRAAKLARLRASAPDLRELAEADAGASARASYALEELRGRPIRQRHAHAFFQRDGACVDVHVSKADPDAEDVARMERILASIRFGERI